MFRRKLDTIGGTFEMTAVYILFFLGGVLAVNLLEGRMEISTDILNRYTLAAFTFQEINYEKYLLHILGLRFRTLVGIWICSKLFPEKFVKRGTLLGISFLAGCVAAMSILANGIWGMWFFAVSFLPHGIFYGFAYGIWYQIPYSYKIEKSWKSNLLLSLLISMLVLIGCICETYLAPVLIEKVIKF